MVISLLACTGAPSPSPEPEDSGTAPGRPALASPAEAEDLDPADDVLHVALTAGLRTFEVAGETIEGYAYNGQNPGPTLRAKVGDTLVVDFTNDLDADTTIHWHGVHAPNDMDGVTWVTQAIAPGDSFTYTIPLTTPGTFWYHPHVDTDGQVDLGLYGFLVVEDPAEPVEDELLVALDAWGEDATDEHGLTDPSRLVWTANGVVDGAATFDGPVRVRLLNASNTSYLDLRGVGTHLADDQGLLGAVDSPDSLVLAPGDRAELEWTDAVDLLNAPYTLAGGSALGDATRLFSVSAGGDGAVWPTTGEAPSADPGRTDLTYVFSGGAADEPWLINGEAWPDVTVSTLALGTDAVIEVRNLSATEHPFHVHGHRFEVLSVDGIAPATRTYEDTVNVGIRSRVRLRMLADNPGDWMVHCHLLGHEEGGMMTVLRVE